MEDKDKIILDLCGGTGSWSAPYKKAGYDVRIITLPDYDVRTYQPPDNVYGILAAPPCTHFSIACAPLWHEKDINGQTAEALEIVRACLRIVEQCKPTLKFWALENPRGRLHKFIGAPTYKFNQSDFGAPYFKPTWLWGDFNFLLVQGPINDHPIRLDTACGANLYDLPEDYNLNIDHCKRAAQRSIYPPAFCQAFFEANR